MQARLLRSSFHDTLPLDAIESIVGMATITRSRGNFNFQQQHPPISRIQRCHMRHSPSESPLSSKTLILISPQTSTQVDETVFSTIQTVGVWHNVTGMLALNYDRSLHGPSRKKKKNSSNFVTNKSVRFVKFSAALFMKDYKTWMICLNLTVRNFTKLNGFSNKLRPTQDLRISLIEVL